MEALRGCPPSARPPRPASAARQPNVNLGATRARTRPATRRAPLRPVWRHGRRWRGERRPSWCYRFAAEPRATCRSHVLNLLAYRGPRVEERLPGARGGISPPGPLGFPQAPKLHIHTRTRAAVDSPEPSLSLGDPFFGVHNQSTSPRPPAGGRAAKRTRKHDTGLTTQLGRRNEEGSVAPEAAVFRPLRRHRRVHALGREAARRVGVEGPHQS